MTLAEREREIERARERLNGTIGKIQDKMTVSGVIDEVLGSGAAPIFETRYANVLDTVRTNPVPVLLIAAGVGWALNRLAKRENLARKRMRGQVIHDDAPADGGRTSFYDLDRPASPAVGRQSGSEIRQVGEQI